MTTILRSELTCPSCIAKIQKQLRLTDGVEFFPEQRMTRAEALRSYTRDAAYAGFEEDLKGTIAVGKLADLVVLSKNILEVSDAELKQTRVDMTIIGGRVVWTRE